MFQHANCGPSQVKSSSNTPVMQGTRRARIKQRGWYAHIRFALAACSSGRRAGWAVHRFDSLVLSEVPGVVWCLCAQEEGTSIHISLYEALLAPRIGAQPFLANRSFTTWGSGDYARGHVSGAATAHVTQSRRHRDEQILSWSPARSCSRGAIVVNSYSALPSSPFLEASCQAHQRPLAGSPTGKWRCASAWAC
jgi:hypothetical protein